jgi:hypothetical protein
MINMKFRSIAAGAAALLCAAALASCGTVENIADSSAPAVETTTEAATATEATTEAEKTEAPTTTEAATEAETTSSAEEETTEQATDAEETEAPVEEDDEIIVEEETEAPVEEETEAPVEEEQAQAVGSFDSSDLSFSGGSLLGDASGLIASLGSTSNIEEAPSCLSNGADMKIYHYSGVDVSCYIDGGSEIIYDITITGGYSTPKGIAPGSSKADVIAAYGEGNDCGSYILYGSEGYGLYIYLSGDTVSYIDYYAEV